MSSLKQKNRICVSLNDRIDEWHEKAEAGDDVGSLARFLGLTENEYRLFLEKGLDALLEWRKKCAN